MSFGRICEAIKFDGLSINNAAAVAEIPQSSLQRFCAGQQGLQMDVLRKVCDFLGLELVRRFDADQLKQYFDKGWIEARADIEAEYEIMKSETWMDEYNVMWQEYAQANELDEDSRSEFSEWKAEAYPEWSEDYDEENYATWESEARAKWQAEERARLESCEWIIITD